VINPFGAISEGRDEMERMLAPMFAGVGKGSIHASETIGVHFVTDDLAVVDGEAVIGGFRNADGSPMPPLRHRFTDVFVYAHQARPGVILSQEFLAPLGISQVAFAAHLGVPVQRINGRINGKRGITPEDPRGCLRRPWIQRRSSGSICRLPMSWLGVDRLNRSKVLPL